MPGSQRDRSEEVAVTADNVTRRQFSTGFRGFDQLEVKSYLTEVAREWRESQAVIDQLRRRVADLERKTAAGLGLDDDTMMEVFGEETARVLGAARSAANDMRAKAEDSMARMLREAQDEAARIRSEAEVQHALVLADAETQAVRSHQANVAEEERVKAACAAELEMARQRGRELLTEAQATRERVLADLARRHKTAKQQLEVLKAGRDRLLESYRVVRDTLEHATGELTHSVEAARAAAQEASHRVQVEPGFAEEAIADIERLLNESSLAHTDSVPMSVEAPIEPAPEPPLEAAAVPAPDESHVAAAAVEPETASAPAVDEAAPAGSVKLFKRKARSDSLPEFATPVETVEPFVVTTPVHDERPATQPPAEELFARLRAEREAALAKAEEVLAAHDEITADAGEIVEVTEVVEVVVIEAPAPIETPVVINASEDPFGARDSLIAPFEKSMALTIKRLLSDEQNEVLDGVRRRKGKAKFSAPQLLPLEDDHLDRYNSALGPELGAAFTASAGTPIPSEADLVAIEEHLAAELVTPLRARLHHCVDVADHTDLGDDLTERIRNAYREYRNSRAAKVARHLACVAYSRGMLHAQVPGTKVCWLVDASYGPCSDAEDNALAGPVELGEPFPTGHLVPPAHSGCRCLVVPVRQ